MTKSVSFTFNFPQVSNLPLDPLQRSHFDIQQDQHILLLYKIRNAWLRSTDLYLSRATDHDDLSRGSQAQLFNLHHTHGRHSDTPTGSQPCPVKQDNKVRQNKINENIDLNSYVTNSTVFNRIKTRSYISIGAMNVVTTRLSFDVGIDALQIIMNFIIILSVMACLRSFCRVFFVVMVAA
jgi:hypothetical protein